MDGCYHKGGGRHFAMCRPLPIDAACVSTSEWTCPGDWGPPHIPPPMPPPPPPPPPQPPCADTYGTCTEWKCCAHAADVCLKKATKAYAACRPISTQAGKGRHKHDCESSDEWLCPQDWISPPPPPQLSPPPCPPAPPPPARASPPPARRRGSHPPPPSPPPPSPSPTTTARDVPAQGQGQGDDDAATPQPHPHTAPAVAAPAADDDADFFDGEPWPGVVEDAPPGPPPSMVAEASAVATETAREVSQYAWASASLLAGAVCNRTTASAATDASAGASAEDGGWEQALPSLGNWSTLVVAAACEDDGELLRDALIAAAVLFMLLCACCACCCRRKRHSIRNVKPRPRPRRGATRMVDDDDGDDGDWEVRTPSTRTRSQGARSVQPAAAKAQRGGGSVRSARAADDVTWQDSEEASALTVSAGRRRERRAMEMHHLPSRQPHASVLD